MVAFKFRDYQIDALNALHDAVEAGARRPLIEIPTGGGKSPIMGQLAMDFQEAGHQVAILAHVTELVEQNAQAVTDLGGYCGRYSAKLKAKDIVSPIISASMQSLAARLRAKGALPPRDVVFVDEAHRIPPREDAQYRRVLEALGAKLVVLLTATPYRMDNGLLYEGKDALADKLAYRVTMGKLTDLGYLSPLVAVPTELAIDLSSVRTRAGEYVEADLDEAAMQIAEAMADDIVAKTAGRKCRIVFASGKRHASAMSDLLAARGLSTRLLLGTTGDAERAEIVADVKAGRVAALINVAVATTGFDARGIDAVVLARATESANLYVQMCGRGTRLAPGKRDCLVLDYGGNISRLGLPEDPHIETTPPRCCRTCDTEYAAHLDKCPHCGAVYVPGDAPAEKECPRCHELCAPQSKECPECRYWFPPTVAECCTHGPMLRGWVEVRGWEASGDGAGGVIVRYDVEDGVELTERLEFGGPDRAGAITRWRTFGGTAETAAGALAEWPHLYCPATVKVKTQDGHILIEAARLREIRRRRK